MSEVSNLHLSIKCLTVGHNNDFHSVRPYSESAPPTLGVLHTWAHFTPTTICKGCMQLSSGCREPWASFAEVLFSHHQGLPTSLRVQAQALTQGPGGPTPPAPWLTPNLISAAPQQVAASGPLHPCPLCIPSPRYQQGHLLVSSKALHTRHLLDKTLPDQPF